MADDSLDRNHPRSPARRRLRAGLLLAAAALSIAVAAGSTLAAYQIVHLEHELEEGGSTVPSGTRCREGDPDCLRNVDPECIDKVCNYLLLGSDTREGLSRGEQARFGTAQPDAGQRSDTIIVVNINPDLDRTIVLSIPRDLRVEIPGHGVGKINTALDFGRDVMVQTVEKLTGFHINHYIQVNFVGFERIVDALGGVPICIDRPMVDELAGLRLSHAGCYNLHGGQALAFVRARHIEGDIIPDFSRISRQQQFMRALIDKALSVGAITRVGEFVDAVKSNVKFDDGLDLYGLQTLTRRLGEIGQKGVTFRVVPATPVTIDDVAYVEMKPAAETLFRLIRQGKLIHGLGLEAPGTPISPANIRVRVYDADSGGGAERVAAYLERAGFLVDTVEPAPPGLTTGAILWARGAEKQQAMVASYLHTLPSMRDGEHAEGLQITVVIGPSFDQPGV